MFYLVAPHQIIGEFPSSTDAGREMGKRRSDPRSGDFLVIEAPNVNHARAQAKAVYDALSRNAKRR